MYWFQYNLGRWVEHNIQPVSTVTISVDRTAASVGKDVKIGLIKIRPFADKTLIIQSI